MGGVFRSGDAAPGSYEDAGRHERRRKVAGRVELVEKEVLEVLGRTGAAGRRDLSEEEAGRLCDAPSPSLHLDTFLLLHPKDPYRTHSSDNRRRPFRLHPISCDEEVVHRDGLDLLLLSTARRNLDDRRTAAEVVVEEEERARSVEVRIRIQWEGIRDGLEVARRRRRLEAEGSESWRRGG